MLRFELEQLLIAGDLKPADVPGVWNEKFSQYFGLTVPNDSQGCLQDIHWSAGLLGYFPTYALGNMYAAQFFEAARRDLGDLDAAFAAGSFRPLKEWLNDKIHRHGKRYPARRLVQIVTGQSLSHQPLIAHLQRKFGELYDLTF
jgi:carboxypeptidase Taq